MPSIEPETGVFLINGPGSGLANIAGLLYTPRREIATDACKSANICQSVPVEIDCSLACTPVGWPMQYGYLQIELFKNDPECPDEIQEPSIYCPYVVVFLGCPPMDPVEDNGIWQGQEIANCTALFQDGVAYGLTLQVCVRMTVGNDGSLTYSVIINRIVPASDIVPPPVDGLNQIASCMSFSKTLRRMDPTEPINVFREYRYPGGLNPITGLPRPNETFHVTRSDLELCPIDVKSVRLTGYLSPFPVGCDGTAENAPSGQCAFDSGFKTYSCFSALIRPTTPGDFPPHWVQMGVNTVALGGPYWCISGTSGSTASTPPLSPGISPVPPLGYTYPAPSDIVTIGCPGEDPVNGDSQQIQFATVGDYDIVLKSVNGGGICAAMRITGVGNPWTIGTQVGFNSTIYNQTGHYIKTFTFAGLTGNPIATIYGLEFPWGIIAQCVEEENPPEMLPPIADEPPKVVDREAEARQSARQKILELRDRMNMVRQNPCIHLGEQLETIPSCGCSGGNLHSCAKHGKCRVTGNTVEMNCWRCQDYESKP